MYRSKGKTQNRSILGRLKGKVLRLHRADLSFRGSLIGQKIIAHKGTLADSRHYSRREIARAMLNAERRKAMALMERQERPFIC